MANTFSASLVPDVARDRGITILQAKLAALALFCRDFSADPIAPKKTIQVPKVTAGATAQTNPTDFEIGDSAISNIPVTVDQLSVSFHITNAQAQQGFRLATLFDINLHVLANKILDAAMAPVTVANYGAATVVAASTAFDTDDLKLLHAAAKDFDMKNLVLDGSYLAQFMPTNHDSFKFGEDGAFGFDKIAPNNRWTGAGANIQGFVCDPQALAVASGASVLDEAVASQMIHDEMIELPMLGLTVRFTCWGSVGSRAVWGCYDVMFGAAKGDTARLKLVASA